MSNINNDRKYQSLIASSPLNKEPDLVIRTSDGIEFGVFRVILQLCSHFFEDMIETPQPSNADRSKIFPRVPIVDVTEDSLTIKRLLKFCYPGASPHLETFDDVLSILEVAHKYDMPEILDQVSSVLLSTRFLEKEPVRVFAIAARYKLEELARISARQTLRYPLLRNPLSENGWVPELRFISTIMYHSLLNYHKRCGEAASASTISPYSWIEVEKTIGIGCKRCCSVGIVTIGVRFGRHVAQSKWWADSMRDIEVTLKEIPCGTTVLDTHIFEEKLAASKCMLCISKGLLEMGNFKKLFAQAVDQAIDQVAFMMLLGIYQKLTGLLNLPTGCS